MRTKVLLCAAALAASLASSMAQSNVYSLNVVGYYNITVGAGQKVMIANQLNTTNNTIGSLLTAPMVNNNDQLFKYAGGFTAYQFITALGGWDPDGNGTLNPGEAAFYVPSVATTLTFVGEVEQGSLTNTLPLSTKVLRASIVPQAGAISTTLLLPGDNNDQLFTYNPTQIPPASYTAYQYITALGGWDPSEPMLSVGQGFFYIKAATGLSPSWVRNFTVQ